MSEEKPAASGEKQGVVAGFREFLMRGNVVELAVAVVVGAAFTQIVNAVVDGVIGPLVGVLGTQNLDSYQSCLRGPCEQNAAGDFVSGVWIGWGAVISAAVTFLITAAVVYFLMIVPMNKFKARLDARKPEEEDPKTELDLLTEIRDELVAQRTARADELAAGLPAGGGSGEGGGQASVVAQHNRGTED